MAEARCCRDSSLGGKQRPVGYAATPEFTEELGESKFNVNAVSVWLMNQQAVNIAALGRDPAASSTRTVSLGMKHAF